MGENLVLNMESHGYTVAVFNRTTQGRRVRRRPRQGEEVRRLPHARRSSSPALKRPRKVMIMVKAGPPVDDVIDEVAAAARAGRHPDRRRQQPLPRHHPPHAASVEGKGLLFIGTGVSGGEEGALKGPVASCPAAIPPAWPHVKPIFQAIAAKAPDGDPVLRLGRARERRRPLRQDGPQRHRIRRHAADLRGLPADEAPARPGADEMHDVFAGWNEGELDSYLIEITRDILGYRDAETAKPLVDLILDTAGQKGTGKWTVTRRLDAGHPADPDRRGRLRPLPVGAEGRARRRRRKVLRGPVAPSRGRRERPSSTTCEMCPVRQQDRLATPRAITLMSAVADERLETQQRRRRPRCGAAAASSAARFLGKIKEAFDRNPQLANLLLDPSSRATPKPASSSFPRPSCALSRTRRINGA